MDHAKKEKKRPKLGELGDRLTQIEDKYHDYEFPKVSIIIPTFNCSQNISTTLDNLLEQKYLDYEIIVVDGGSTDRTVEIVKGYRDDRIRFYSAAGYRYEMLNKGISQAKGRYLNFLFPGDFYIYKETLRLMMGLALETDEPELLYCGTLLRSGREGAGVKILLRELSLRLLKRGQQPTSLQSCWFREDVFGILGKFDTTYTLRGGYELMCRFVLHGGFNVCTTKRVLTDYDLRFITKEMVFRHFAETWRTIRKYFGFFTSMRWLFIQKDIYRLLKLWYRATKVALFGR